MCIVKHVSDSGCVHDKTNHPNGFDDTKCFDETESDHGFQLTSRYKVYRRNNIDKRCQVHYRFEYSNIMFILNFIIIVADFGICDMRFAISMKVALRSIKQPDSSSIKLLYEIANRISHIFPATMIMKFGIIHP